MTHSNSKPTYFNITLQVNESEKNNLSDQLLELGALAVSDLGITNELVVLSIDPTLLSNTYPHLKCEIVQNWEYKWMENFTGHFLTPATYILPESQQLPNTCHPQHTIVLDPRDAFGDGNHPTTQLCAEALEAITLLQQNKETCIDLGTGTGVLAILAQKIGYKHVEATDIEPSSLYKAEKNCILNNSTDISIYHSDILKNPPTKKYDLIIANLLTHILLESLDNLKKCLKPESYLILSGIGAQWKEEFDSAINLQQLDIVIHTKKDGWLCYCLKQKSSI